MPYISFSNFTGFLESLRKSYAVYVPVKKDRSRFYAHYTSPVDLSAIGEVRAFEPLKSFFSRAREKVAVDFKPEVPLSGDKPFCIVGAKACDLKGFKIQDFVFQNHDYPDPFYIKLRQDNLIISADCTFALDTCFCLSLGVKPYPQGDYDINLSPVKEGFVVESGSQKGKALIQENAALFQSPTEAHVFQRDERRKSVEGEVALNIKESAIPDQDSLEGAVAKGYDSDVWETEAKTCVECGACNAICPTCHCFLLYDQKNQARMERLKVWDSCLVKDFARVAGGANPRPRLWMRLRNRFEKKFDFFPKVAQIYACTGCGRCITACPAKIDIRKVLKKLVNNA